LNLTLPANIEKVEKMYKKFKLFERAFDFVLKLFWFALLCKWLFAEVNIHDYIK
jgi:predicted Zn-dependent protease